MYKCTQKNNFERETHQYKTSHHNRHNLQCPSSGILGRMKKEVLSQLRFDEGAINRLVGVPT